MTRALRLPRTKSNRAQTIECDLSPESLRKASRDILAFILAQAIHDGVGIIRLGYDQKGNTVLNYSALSGSPPDQAWDMVAPPPICYSRLFQTIVSLTDFEPGARLTGSLAVKDRTHRNVRVEINATSEMRLILREPV